MTQGMKFDGEKPRTDLLATAPLLAIAEVLGHGAKKYSAHNWRSGINYSRVYGAIQRHLMAFWDNEDIDPESGMHHLAHAMTELMFLMEFVQKPHLYSRFDDRYVPDNAVVTPKVHAGIDFAVPAEDLPPGAIEVVDEIPKKPGMFGGMFSKELADSDHGNAEG